MEENSYIGSDGDSTCYWNKRTDSGNYTCEAKRVVNKLIMESSTTVVMIPSELFPPV